MSNDLAELAKKGEWAIINMPERMPENHFWIRCSCGLDVLLELNGKKPPLQYEYVGLCDTCGTHYLLKVTW